MEASRSISRRRFLAAGAGTAAAFAAAGLLPAGAWAHGGGQRHGRRERLIPKRRIGIQLFTVRDLLAADAAGTLAALAEIGYREVEVAGVPAGHTAESFRALLDQNGMRAIGNHHFTGPALVPLFGDRPVEAILDEAETLGQKYTGTAALSIPPGVVEGVGEPQTADRYRELAELANEWGEAAGRARAALLRAPPLLGLRSGPDDGRDPVPGAGRRDRRGPRLVRAGHLLDGLRRRRPARLDPRFQDRFPLFHARTASPTRRAATSTRASRTWARARSTSRRSSGPWTTRAATTSSWSATTSRTPWRLRRSRTTTCATCAPRSAGAAGATATARATTTTATAAVGTSSGGRRCAEPGGCARR